MYIYPINNSGDNNDFLKTFLNNTLNNKNYLGNKRKSIYEINVFDDNENTKEINKELGENYSQREGELIEDQSNLDEKKENII